MILSEVLLDKWNMFHIKFRKDLNRVKILVKVANIANVVIFPLKRRYNISYYLNYLFIIWKQTWYEVGITTSLANNFFKNKYKSLVSGLHARRRRPVRRHC